MLSIGDKVPDFEVEVFQNDDAKKIKMSDFKGKWVVLVFYPADFTFVCPTELEEAANLYGEFKKENAELMSVSTDTIFVHKAWHDNSPSIKKINYPMVADPTGELCRLFGTYIAKEGLSLRGTFIIDPDGNLVSMEVNDNSIGRNIRETLRKLRAASYVRSNPGIACPVNWEPGSKTLKPGMDLVGKI